MVQLSEALAASILLISAIPSLAEQSISTAEQSTQTNTAVTVAMLQELAEREGMIMEALLRFIMAQSMPMEVMAQGSEFLQAVKMAVPLLCTEER